MSTSEIYGIIISSVVIIFCICCCFCFHAQLCILLKRLTRLNDHAQVLPSTDLSTRPSQYNTLQSEGSITNRPLTSAQTSINELFEVLQDLRSNQTLTEAEK